MKKANPRTRQLLADILTVQNQAVLAVDEYQQVGLINYRDSYFVILIVLFSLCYSYLVITDVTLVTVIVDIVTVTVDIPTVV